MQPTQFDWESQHKFLLNDFHRLLEAKRELLPGRVQRALTLLWDEVRDLEQRIDTLAAELESVALEEPVIQNLLQVPGIGVLTATALYATVGDIHAFRNGRQLACWFGLTPREHSSGSRRRLGRISKQGDSYVRMLLIHGARAALNAARRADRAGQPLTELQRWALQRAQHAHPNKAAVALANKLARIAWVVWYHERQFNGDHALRTAA